MLTAVFVVVHHLFLLNRLLLFKNVFGIRYLSFFYHDFCHFRVFFLIFVVCFLLQCWLVSLIVLPQHLLFVTWYLHKISTIIIISINITVFDIERKINWTSIYFIDLLDHFFILQFIIQNKHICVWHLNQKSPIICNLS